MGYKIIVFVVALSLVYSTSAIPGKASFYTKSIPSACYKNETQEGNMVASVGDSLWNNGTICGKKIQVRCTAAKGCKGSKMVTVKVIAHCIGCGPRINLSYSAFTSIVNIDEAIIIDIDYQLL
ncbi:putative EG45-like domain containing protein 1 [Impatiens glandulifera]|uniref:putative EG45-like domain containing protein 1 n=1 Tax=Impatiens glandulifera TaxID=253017 RepID=UPI001FB16F3B|nr:putative EG45-like domain containing protein 1 [Impatiens glandulifera]